MRMHGAGSGTHGPRRDKPMSTICPRCGAAIHSETNPTCYNCLRIEREQRRFGQRRPPESQRVSSSPPIEKVEEKKQNVETVVSREIVNREMQRKAINQLLSDLYNSNSRQLSDILRDGKLTPQQITQLRDEQLTEYLDALVAELFAFWLKKLRWQVYATLRAKYALDGKQPPMKRTLMKQYNISWEQIDRYQEEGLRHLRFGSNLAHWENLVVKTARNTLHKADKIGRHSSR